MVRTSGEKDRGRCSNENMEEEVSGYQNIGIPKTEVQICYTKTTKREEA